MSKEPSVVVAFRKGHNAAKAGCLESICPHDANNPLRDCWLRGYRHYQTVNRYGLMHYAAAARCMADAHGNGFNHRANKEFEMTAFLNVFHPELGKDKIREYAKDAGEKANGR